jgi:beta-lactamase class C
VNRKDGGVDRRAAAVSLLASVLTGPTGAQGGAKTVSGTVSAAFLPVIAAHDVPGMAVGVLHAGTRHEFHHGVASLESRRPVTSDTLFEIGSLSKAFTATLAACAQESGRLSLADPPGHHVPQLRGSAIDRASLLHLGTYTAGGLPLQFPGEVTTLASAIAYYRGFRPSAPPGTQRRYSNPSIGLLGHATAMALRQDFVEACEGDMFARMGLRRTFLRVPEAAMPGYAWGYDPANQPIRVRPGMFDAQAYGVKSTLTDMLTFLELQLDPGRAGPLLRRAVELTHVAHFSVGPMVQGLGWEQYPWPAGRQQLLDGNSARMALEPHAARAVGPAGVTWPATLFNKTGSTNGFGAYAAFVPARGIGIVMLANRNIPIAARVGAAHKVLAALG